MAQCNSSKQPQIYHAHSRTATAPDRVNLAKRQLPQPISKDRCPSRTRRHHSGNPKLDIETCSKAVQQHTLREHETHVAHLRSHGYRRGASLWIPTEGFLTMGSHRQSLTMNQCNSSKQLQIARATSRKAAAPDPADLAKT